MNVADLSPLANHLWQSTLCAALAWLLTLALRENRAAVRYWVWLAASVKFLVPFSWLIRVGGHLGWSIAKPIAAAPNSWPLVEQISQPFSASPAVAHMAAPASPSLLPGALFAVWG